MKSLRNLQITILSQNKIIRTHIKDLISENCTRIENFTWPLFTLQWIEYTKAVQKSEIPGLTCMHELMALLLYAYFEKIHFFYKHQKYDFLEKSLKLKYIFKNTLRSFASYAFALWQQMLQLFNMLRRSDFEA